MFLGLLCFFCRHKIACLFIDNRVIAILVDVNHIIPGATRKCIPSVACKDNLLVRRRSCDFQKSPLAQQPVISIAAIERIVSFHPGRGPTEHQGVFRIPSQYVVAGAAHNHVVAAVAIEIVIPRAAIDLIVAISAKDLIAAASAGNHVIAAGGEYDFPAAAALNRIISLSALDRDLLLEPRTDRHLIRPVAGDNQNARDRRFGEASVCNTVVDENPGNIGRIEADGDDIVASRAVDPQDATQQRCRQQLPALQGFDNRANRIGRNASV